MQHALVFGGSGQIGRPLIGLLADDGWRITAVTRQSLDVLHDTPQIAWVQGSLQALPKLEGRYDAVISCGPLDHFAHWWAHDALRSPRVVAFGSTSVEVKQDSEDDEERALAERLREGEARLRHACGEKKAALTLLRPTLIYGAGGDRTLTRIAAMARRYNRFVLPKGAKGLRQPVHAQDLARAAFDVLDNPATHGQTYALPGGETLQYDAMVERVLHVLEPPVPLHRVPDVLFWALMSVAKATGRLSGLTPAIVWRMRQDLVFDAAPAVRDFGYAPRKFRPTLRALADEVVD